MQKQCVGWVLGVLALFVGGARVNADIEPAGSADDFVDRIGFCTHWGYTDTSYGLAYDQVKTLLGNLGVRHIRDGWHGREEDLYSTFGIKTTLIFGPGTPPPQAATLVQQHRALVEMAENPNEVDLFATSAQYKGLGFPAGPRLYAKELYAALKRNRATANVPVIAPSVGRADSNRQLAPLNSFDYLVMHSYAGGAMPSQSLTSEVNNPLLTAYGLLIPGEALKPFVVTESGYHTALGSNVVLAGAQAGVTEKAQAKYLPRHFATYFNAGIRRTFAYELLDEFPDYKTDERDATNAEACFGILKHDLVPKPAYHALKNLMSLLSETQWNPKAQRWEAVEKAAPRASFPHALDFTLSGSTTNLRHTLLQKANGDFYLLLWQEVSSFDRKTRQDIANPTISVNVTLHTGMRAGEVFVPGGASTSSQKIASPEHFTLDVPDEIVVVRLAPTPLQGNPPTPLTAPKGLVAQTTGTTARLRWQSSGGAPPMTYAIYRMGAYIAQVRKPEFADTNLLPGSGYTYVVRGVDRRGSVSGPATVLATTADAFPDVVITQIKLSPPEPQPGDVVTISASIMNIGNAPTPARVVHGVAFFVDGVLVSWADTFSGPLAPGKFHTVAANNGPQGSATVTWTAGPNKIRALFDDVNRMVEREKKNNSMEITVP